MVPKKRRGPAPTGKGVQIQVRLHEPMLSRVDEWVRKFAPGEGLSRPEAIRRMLNEYLDTCGIGAKK